MTYRPTRAAQEAVHFHSGTTHGIKVTEIRRFGGPRDATALSISGWSVRLVREVVGQYACEPGLHDAPGLG
jgi:hypothetical protein